MYHDDRVLQALQKPKETKDLQKNYDRTEEGNPVKFSVGLNKYMPDEDILFFLSPTADYASDPCYLGNQIRFLYDTIYSNHKGRIIILNSGDLGCHTVQLKLNKDSIDGEVIEETDSITRNWRRLFFDGLGPDRKDNVEEMIKSGRLVYTDWRDWNGMDIAQNDNYKEDDVDKRIHALRKLSSELEQNKALFEGFSKNADLFKEYYELTLQEYEKEDSDVRKAIDAWTKVFFDKCFSPSQMKGREEAIWKCVRSYCLEESVVAAMWEEYVRQMVYPFGLNRDLSNPARAAWAAVAKNLRKGNRDGVKYLTLSLPSKKGAQQAEEAERIRQQAETAAMRIAKLEAEKAELQKKLETLTDEVVYNTEKLKLAKTANPKFRERLEQEAVEGLDKVVEYASSSSEEVSEDDTKAASPPKPGSPLDSGRRTSVEHPRTAPVVTPKSLSPNGSNSVSPLNSGRKNSIEIETKAVAEVKAKGEEKITKETVLASAQMGYFSVGKQP
ncbi:MAG TPA: hypothetical protein VGU44_00550, partial [Gammaproteobacteria bacterium]|nr:hypothetical protein [Gammaproteobacteria bacterium]